MTEQTEAQRIDTGIAAQWLVIEKAQTRLGWAYDTLTRRCAEDRGLKGTWRRGHLVFPVTRAEALDWITERAERDPEGYDIRNGYQNTNAKVLAEIEERQATLDAEVAKEHELQSEYTGWSRFFVVTSSTGHIHSSTRCHTCKITTTFGWLPELSGKTEEDAVTECGPALCSVCFPSAPLDHLGKLTAAQARKLAFQG